jgi:hypothetical protein
MVAPGTNVISAESVGSFLALRFPESHVDGTGEYAYIRMTGTSMAVAVSAVLPLSSSNWHRS